MKNRQEIRVKINKAKRETVNKIKILITNSFNKIWLDNSSINRYFVVVLELITTL
jgi:hypothetical protein